MKQSVKRIISMLLVVVMLVSILPVNAFAVTEEDTENVSAAEPVNSSDGSEAGPDSPLWGGNSSPVVDSDTGNPDDTRTSEEEKGPVPSAGSEKEKDPTLPAGSEEEKDPDLPEGGENDVTNVPSEDDEGEEPGEDEATDETEVTIAALLEANPTATVSVYTQKVVDGVAQDLAETATLTVGYVSQKAPAALGEGKTFAGAYAIVGGESKAITAVAVMDDERYVETDGALVKLGASDLIVLKYTEYTEAAEEIPLAPRRMARLKSGEEIALLDLSYVSVYTQKVVGDISLTPVEGGSIITGSFSATAPSLLGEGKTYLGAYVHKGGIDGPRYAVYAVEVDAEDSTTRYVTMADGQTGMTALDSGDVLVIQYSEVPNTGSVTFKYTLDGEALNPEAADFPLLPTSNLVDGKYDSDVDLKIWLPRQVGYDYIEVNSIILADAKGTSVTAVPAGVNNLFTVSAEQLQTLSGDLTATVSLNKNLQEANFFFSGANSVWIMPNDGHFRNGGSNSSKMDHGSNESASERTYYYTPYSQSVTFELKAFLEWPGDAGAGKKLNKVSIDGVNLALPDAATANSSVSTPIGGGYEVVVTCIEPGDTRGEVYKQGAPRYTVTLTAPNGSLVHGNFNVSTNYKNVDNSFEVWANQLDGVGNIVKIENNGGSWNPYDDSQGNKAETQLRPNGNGFWRRDNNNTTKIFAKIQDGYNWDDDSWDVALLISSSLVTLPRAQDGNDYSKPCYYIETSESSGADRGSVIINLPANMGAGSDDIRIVIKGTKRNVQVKYDLNGGSWKNGETDPAQRLALTLDQYGFNLTSQVPTKTENDQELVFTGWKLDTGTEVHPSGDLYTTNETVFSSRPIVDNAFTFTFVAQWVPKDQEHTTPYTIQVTALDKDGNAVTVRVPTWEESGITGKRTYLDGNKIVAKAGLDPDKYISVPTNVLTKVLGDNDTFDLLFVEKIHPQITVTKATATTTAKPGDTVKYTITVKNTGDVDINAANTPKGITVTDSKVPDWSQKITELAVGAEQTYTDVECTIPAGTQGDFTNLAQASGTFVDTRYLDSDADYPEYNLTGSDAKTITIEQEARELKASDLNPILYDGLAHLPESVLKQIKATVKDKNDPSKEMVYGVDYDIVKKVQDHTIAYTGDATNVTEAGVTVTIKGLGAYAHSSATVMYKIVPRALTIKTYDATKTYDGKALTQSYVSVFGLQNDETVSVEATGSQTNAGTSENGYKITWNGTAKQSNYVIYENLGKLTVNKAKLSITGLSDTRIYNGRTLYGGSYEVRGTIVDGDFTVIATGCSQTDVGSSPNKVSCEFAEGKADNYELTLQDGTLTVIPAPLTIETGSATKVWDGQPLTNSEITVTGLVDGEATYKTTGSQTVVGSSDNTYELTWTGNGKASNYEIKTVTLGKLTVTGTGTVVTKTHADGTYKAGDDVTFTINVTNPYEEAKDVTVTEQDDVTITGITVNRSEYKFTQAGNQVVVKDVPSKGVAVITATYTLTAVDGAAGSYKNEVTVEIGGNSFNDDDTVTVQKELKAEKPQDVTYNGTSQVQEPVVKDKNTGDVLTKDVDYTLTYSEDTTNVGTVTVTITGINDYAGSNGSVTYKITKAILVLQVGSAEKKYDGQPLTEHSFKFADGTALVGQDKGKVLTLNYPDSQTLVGTKPNTATIKDYGGVDENNYKILIKNGTLTVTDGTETAPVDPKLVVTKTHDETRAYKENDEVTFTIEVTNIYDKEMKITLVEQDGMTMESSDSTTSPQPANSLVFDKVQPGDTVTATARYTITKADVESGTFSNKVTAKFDGEKDFETTDTVKLTGLKVEKKTTSTPANGSTYALGETITYAVTVKNIGNDPLTNITVTDELTGDTWTIDSLAPGVTAEAFTASHEVTEDDILAGKVVNVATAKTDDPDGPEGTGTTEDDTDEIDTTLEVKKEADRDKAVEGEKVTYTITVENKGNVDFPNVVVSDGLEGAKITSVNAKNGYTSNDNGPITLNKLEVGETAAITVEYTITEADAEKGTVHNVAIAKGDPIPDPADPDKSKTPEGQGEEDVDTEPMDTTLTVTKTADKDKAKAGETITYTITVKNDGNVDYKNVVVTDQFLAKDGESFVSGAVITKVAIGGKTVKVTDGSSYTIDVLKAGETATITAEYTVQESDEGTITNVAIAKGETNDPDKVPEGGSDKVPTDVVFDLTVKKEWKGDSILIRPKSIKVTVFKDGIRYTDTVEITALGGWSAKFTVPKDGSAYTVVEEAVTGYTVKYSAMESNTLTITNTKQTKPGGGLLQTGQLNWPIPLLTFLGISMITGGAALTVGKKKDKYES